MTIAQIAEKVLNDAGKPLDVDEIYDQIVARKLFEFRTANPRGVLRNQIRRQCEGTPQAARAKVLLFVQGPDGRYSPRGGNALG